MKNCCLRGGRGSGLIDTDHNNTALTITLLSETQTDDKGTGNADSKEKSYKILL